MKNTLVLFKSGWNLPLTNGFKSRESSSTSTYSDNDKAILFVPANNAFILYNVDGYNVVSPGVNSGNEIFAKSNRVIGVAELDGGITVAEYRVSETVKHVCLFDRKKREVLYAGVTKDNGMTYSNYVLDFKEKRDGTVIWLALMPYLIDPNGDSAPNEISMCCNCWKDTGIQEYKNFYNGGSELPSSLLNSCYMVSDYLTTVLGTEELKVTMPLLGIFEAPSPEIMAAKAYMPSDDAVLSGFFTVVGLTEKARMPKKTISSGEELYCAFALDSDFAEKNRDLIPKMPSYYVVPKWVVKASHNIMYHHKNLNLDSSMKNNNLGLFGEPGSGKTEGAKAIASALGLPFTHISLSAGSGEDAFTGLIIPKVENNNGDGEIMNKLIELYGNTETIMQAIIMSPETVYEEMTGTECKNITSAQCLTKFNELTQSSNKSNNIQYEFVESEFCKAIEKGWLIVVEEFTNVRDAGIAMIINQLMDGYQEITLPTGKVINRHENTVIVFAANVDEAQCGEFEASTLSRLKPIYKVATPNKTVLINRVKSITGYDDNDILDKMADVCLTLNKYIKEHALVGVCGVREFAGWVLQYVANLDYDEDATLREAAIETIVPTASPHSDDMDDIIRDVVDMMLND